MYEIDNVLKLCNSLFSVSRSVFEMRKLTLQFSIRWRCERTHLVAHIQFTIPRQHVYKNSSNRSEIKRVTRDFSWHTAHIYFLISFFIFFFSPFTVSIFFSLLHQFSRHVHSKSSIMVTVKILLCHLKCIKYI